MTSTNPKFPNPFILSVIFMACLYFLSSRSYASEISTPSNTSAFSNVSGIVDTDIFSKIDRRKAVSTLFAEIPEDGNACFLLSENRDSRNFYLFTYDTERAGYPHVDHYRRLGLVPFNRGVIFYRYIPSPTFAGGKWDRIGMFIDYYMLDEFRQGEKYHFFYGTHDIYDCPTTCTDNVIFSPKYLPFAGFSIFYCIYCTVRLVLPVLAPVLFLFVFRSLYSRVLALLRRFI